MVHPNHNGICAASAIRIQIHSVAVWRLRKSRCSSFARTFYSFYVIVRSMSKAVSDLSSSIREAEKTLIHEAASASAVNDSIAKGKAVVAGVDSAVKAALSTPLDAQDCMLRTNSVKDYLNEERKVLQTLQKSVAGVDSAQSVRSGCEVQGGNVMSLSEFSNVESIVYPTTYHCIDFLTNHLLRKRRPEGSYSDRALEIAKAYRLGYKSSLTNRARLTEDLKNLEPDIVNAVWRRMVLYVRQQGHQTALPGVGTECKELAELKALVGSVADVVYLEALNCRAIEEVENEKAECRALISVLEQLCLQQSRLLHAEAVQQENGSTLAKVHDTVTAAVSTLATAAEGYRSMLSYIDNLESNTQESEKVASGSCRETSVGPYAVLRRLLMRYQNNLIHLNDFIEKAEGKEASLKESVLKSLSGPREQQEEKMKAIQEVLLQVQVARKTKLTPLQRFKRHAFVSFTLHPDSFLQEAQMFVKP